MASYQSMLRWGCAAVALLGCSAAPSEGTPVPMRALVLTGNGDAAPHGRSDELGTTLFGRCAPAGASSATLDLQPVTLGVRFASDVAGTVRAVRFFRGVAEGFPEDGFPVAIYDEAGRTIATGVATRGQNPASGWLTAPLDRELRIEAGRSYVAAYHAPSGRYAYEYGGLASGVSAPPPLRVLVTGASRGRVAR